MENMEYRDMSSYEEDCREGLLFVGWTDKWGMKVTPWYEMDLIKFSFIEKGKSGKGHSFDVSIPARKNHSFDFMDFSHEVMHDIRTPFDFCETMKKERADGEKYPSRYRFSTGHNGEKSVGICNSSTGDGYCINAGTVCNGKKVYASIPVSYYDIYDMVTAFRETYAEREQKLKQIRKEAILTRGDRIQAARESKEMEPLAVSTISALDKQPNGDYLLQARTQTGECINIRFTQQAVQQMNEINASCFTIFQQRTAEKATCFSFFGKRKNGQQKPAEYVFEKFYKPSLA